MFFGVVSIAAGVLAIADAIFQLFPRTVVQGHVVQKSKWPIPLRLLEAAIGVGFIVLGIWLLTQG